MRYNKYCSNKYSNQYNTDNDNLTLNGYDGACEVASKEYACSCNETMKPKHEENTEAKCACVPKVPCDNCIEPCKCCNGVTCDFNSGKAQAIRTVVKRLFGHRTAETCPAMEELTIVEGSVAMAVAIEVIPCNCMCACPPIDSTSKFTVKCINVEAKSVNLTKDPEVKLNGKVITVVKNTVSGCYDGVITKDILRCLEKCKAEQGELCIRAEQWEFEGVITITGCVATAGQSCEFTITLTTVEPITFADNTVFYMGDICVTDGEFKLCFDPKFCFQVNSITSDGTSLTVEGPFKLSVEAEVNIYKEQEVCIQAVIVE